MTRYNYALLADIGGTYARFACSINGSTELINIQKLNCADFKTSGMAINAYLNHFGIHNISSICMAVAGPIKDDGVKFTNNTWEVSTQTLKDQYKVEFVKLLNDFEAIAYSLLQLKKDQLLPISNTSCISDKNNSKFCVLGPGSGFGIASLTCQDKRTFTSSSEGGHISFAPVNEVQQSLYSILDKKFDRVTNEHLLSGQGIINIYKSLCEMECIECLLSSPADIFTNAINSNNHVAKNTIQIFLEILGQVAGDIALILNAYDGVYIAGGIVQRYPELIGNSSFRKSFENKGKHSFLLKNTPTTLITYPYSGLLGASCYSRYFI